MPPPIAVPHRLLSPDERWQDPRRRGACTRARGVGGTWDACAPALCPATLRTWRRHRCKRRELRHHRPLHALLQVYISDGGLKVRHDRRRTGVGLSPHSGDRSRGTGDARSLGRARPVVPLLPRDVHADRHPRPLERHVLWVSPRSTAVRAHATCANGRRTRRGGARPPKRASCISPFRASCSAIKLPDGSSLDLTGKTFENYRYARESAGAGAHRAVRPWRTSAPVATREGQ